MGSRSLSASWRPAHIPKGRPFRPCDYNTLSRAGFPSWPFRHRNPVEERLWGPLAGSPPLQPLVGGQGGPYSAPLFIPAWCGRHLGVPATRCRDEHSLQFLCGSLCYGRFTAVAWAPIEGWEYATEQCSVAPWWGGRDHRSEVGWSHFRDVSTS